MGPHLSALEICRADSTLMGDGGVGNDAEERGGEGGHHLKMRRLNLINP